MTCGRNSLKLIHERRSQIAAAETSELSGSSMAVAETKLVPDIQKTAELVQDISASSKAQASGTDQINGSIQQLSQVISRTSVLPKRWLPQPKSLPIRPPCSRT